MSAAGPENLLTAWSRLLFDSLAAAGVRDVIASPGSRSTPFLLAAAAHPALRVHDVIDERAAAFFALGQARVTGTPSVLLCTSGSAAAHYLPAVIEADASDVPLVIVTADRPAELLHVAANQTIDQRLLFEGYARRIVDVGAPDAAPSALRGLRRLAAQAVALARAPRAGVVHLNLRARKPLEPVDAVSGPAHALEAQVRALMDEPLPRAHEGCPRAPAEAIEALAQRCVAARRGLIVAGPSAASQRRVRRAIRQFADASGFPLLADPASQLRFTGRADAAAATLIDGADWMYRLPAADQAWRPDFVVQLGAPPTSGPWEAFLARHPDIERVVIAPTGWPDPHSSARAIVHADIAASCADLAQAIARLRAGAAAPLEFARAVADADARVRELLDADLRARGDALGEAAVARTVAESLPDDAWLVLGNSLPIRTVDAWCTGRMADLRVLSQRGASGIDGLISGAAGAASVADDPVLLLVGDVSALHDIGGLALAGGLRIPFVVVIVNNDGGRIFEQLPVARTADDATLRHFTTPHGLDFAHAARFYGHAFVRAHSVPALREALAVALTRPACTVIDAIVPPGGAAEERTRVATSLAARICA